MIGGGAGAIAVVGAVLAIVGVIGWDFHSSPRRSPASAPCSSAA